MAITGELPHLDVAAQIPDLFLSDDQCLTHQDAIKSLFFNGYYAAMASYHTSAEKHLLKLSDCAENNKQQQLYFNGMRTYSAAISAIDDEMSKALEAGASTATISDDADKSLGLIESDTIDREIAAKSSVAAIRSRSADLVKALDIRMSPVMGETLTAETNPLGAVRLVNLYANSLRSHNFELDVELALIKYFGQKIAKDLAEIYEQIDSYLIGQDIFPVLPRSSEPTRDSVMGAVSDREKQPEANDADDAKSSKELVEAIHTLINRINIQETASPQVHMLMGGAQVPSLTEIANGESKVAGVDFTNQLMAPSANQTTSIEIVDSELLTRINEQPQEFAKSVQLVGLIFQYMLDEQALPSCVKALLSYLHTPYLQLSIEVPNMLHDPKHPARRLIDEMVEAGIRWVSEEGDSQYGMLELIHSTVSSVAEMSPCNEEQIGALCDDFVKQHQRVARKVAIAERRTQERANTKLSKHLAEKKVLADYKKIKPSKAPAILIDLLKGAWLQHSVRLFQQGDMDAYNKAIRFAQLLVASQSVKFFKNEEDYAQACSLVYRNIDKGLEQIGYDRKARTLLITDIRKLHQKKAGRKPKATPITVEEQYEKLNPRTGEFLEHLKLMESGSWIERTLDGATKRYRLSAVKGKESFMLMDQSGRDGEIISMERLAHQFAEGYCKVLSGASKPFLERALKSIYNSMHEAAGE